MGYWQPVATTAPTRPRDDQGYEVPGNDCSWWDAQLDPAVTLGLSELEWHPSDTDEAHFWGVSGTYADKAVGFRIPRLLEHRDGTLVDDEIMVVIELRLTPPRLGSWVIEAPSKWFRKRRGWALNRPKFATGDPWFDQEAGSWAWGCADGPQALRDALAPALPRIRELLDGNPGAIVTESTISAWIPVPEIPDRLPRLLSLVRIL